MLSYPLPFFMMHPWGIDCNIWQDISIDIVGPLPKSNEKNTIMVIINRFTKMIWLKATTINIFSEEITKIHRDEIWKLYGVLRKILSNRGPQFASRFIKELMKALGTKKMLLTAYYPYIDGQMERIMSRLKKMDLIYFLFFSFFIFFLIYFSIFYF